MTTLQAIYFPVLSDRCVAVMQDPAYQVVRDHKRGGYVAIAMPVTHGTRGGLLCANGAN